MKCLTCDENNPLMFYKDNSRSTKLSSKCKACTRKRLTALRTPEFRREAKKRNRYNKLAKSERKCTKCNQVKSKEKDFTKRTYICDGCAYIKQKQEGDIYCSRCKTYQSPSQVRKTVCQICIEKNPDLPDGYIQCSQCNSIKVRHGKSGVVYSKNQKSLCEDCHLENWSKLSEEEKFYRCVASNIKGSRSRAKERNFEHDIEIEDFEYHTHCPILNIAYTYLEGSMSAPSLDRVDTTKGYVKGNVKIISRRANSLKSDASISDIEKLLKYMKK